MIERLEMFIALANAGHFGRAAAAMGVTQPTLSSAIRALEDQLGVQLVRRGARYEGLTAEGERALDWALRMVADARAMKAEMRMARRGGLDDELRIGVIPTALPAVGELTQPLLARHPGLRLTVVSRSAGEIEAQVERLELDAGLTYVEAPPRGFTARPLYRERYAVLAAAEADLPARPLSWAEVGRLPLCMLTSEMRNRQIVDRHLAAAGMTTAPRITSNSVIVLVGHVLTGRWVTVVPLATAELFLSDRLRMAPVEPGDGAEAPVVGFVALDREPRAPAVDALLALAGERVIDNSYRLTTHEH